MRACSRSDINWLANKVKCGCSYICQPLHNRATCRGFTEKKNVFLLEKSDLTYFKHWTETVIFLSLHRYLHCAFQSHWLGWEWCLLEKNPPVHNQQGSKQRRDLRVNCPHNLGTTSGAQLHSTLGWSAVGLVPGCTGETPAPEKCPWSCKTYHPHETDPWGAGKGKSAAEPLGPNCLFMHRFHDKQPSPDMVCIIQVGPGF